LQEKPRLEVPRAFHEAAIAGFGDTVHNACTELVFNFDEIGVSEWEDRIERRAILPSTMSGDTIATGPQEFETYIRCGVHFSRR
jgi:hypothetical protein